MEPVFIPVFIIATLSWSLLKQEEEDFTAAQKKITELHEISRDQWVAFELTRTMVSSDKD